MLSLPKILAPIDFSERSPATARCAGELACHFRSELSLLYVLDTTPYEFSGYGVTAFTFDLLPMENNAKERLKGFLPGEFQNMQVRRLVLSGDPATRIVSYAQSEGMSLIVIPTHGYGPFRRFILGSTAAKILHDATCPVFTGVHLPESAFGPRGFQKILCAVDFCAESERALLWASEFAAEFHSQLTVAHIAPLPEGVEYFDSGLRERLAREAHEKVAAMLKRTGVAGDVAIEEDNNVPRAICAAAGRQEADLVVIGRGSDTLLGRLRTNAYSIIRQSPCPVVSV
jgi:nucleotide-binding universal stress UspA family protein